MSFRRFGRGIARLLMQGLARRIPKVAVRSSNLAQRARPLVNLLRYGVRSYSRPLLVAIADHRSRGQRIYQMQARDRLVFRRRQRDHDGLHLVKALFTTNERYNQSLIQENAWPRTLDGYEIGRNIACGCHAAVYALRLRCDDTKEKRRGSFSAGPEPSEPSAQQSPLDDAFATYPLALKLMFNYHLELPDRHLWQEMGAELIPLHNRQGIPPVPLNGTIRRLPQTMPRHPNVIKLCTAFVDRIPKLDDAHLLYPEALPTSDIYDYLIEEPRTLFIVMKRYRMTLREYMLTMPRNYWTGRVMLGQLLEAVVYLFEHTVSHRDMKSDNILLDFDQPDEAPHLVVSDFGCALAIGSWQLPYEHDGVDLGGNLALRAPEIRCARPGPGKVVDYRAADLWAAGTLAYEIMTRMNPFYSQLKSSNYTEVELPPLPKRVHYSIANLVPDMLKRDPNQRVDCRVAANVLSISLFRFGDDLRRHFNNFFGLSSLVVDCNNFNNNGTFGRTLRLVGGRVQRALDEMAALFAAETILARRMSPELVVSRAELQLRATFLARLDREQLWSALGGYFLVDLPDDPPTGECN